MDCESPPAEGVRESAHVLGGVRYAPSDLTRRTTVAGTVVHQHPYAGALDRRDDVRSLPPGARRPVVGDDRCPVLRTVQAVVHHSVVDDQLVRCRERYGGHIGLHTDIQSDHTVLRARS